MLSARRSWWRVGLAILAFALAMLPLTLSAGGEKMRSDAWEPPAGADQVVLCIPKYSGGEGALASNVGTVQFLQGSTPPRQADLTVSITMHGGTQVDFVFPTFNRVWFGWWLYQTGPM